METNDLDLTGNLGSYTLLVDANFSVVPNRRVGVRFDGFNGSDNNLDLWDLSGVAPNSWNTYSVNFSLDASDTEGRIEFRSGNTGGATLAPFRIDNFTLIYNDAAGGPQVVFLEDFEDEMPGATSTSINTTNGSGADVVASVPEPASSMLLGTAGIFGLLRRRK